MYLDGSYILIYGAKSMPKEKDKIIFRQYTNEDLKRLARLSFQIGRYSSINYEMACNFKKGDKIKMISKDWSFKLDEEQYGKLEKWYNEICAEREEEDYFGAIGGGISFEITPTSIGTFVKAKCCGKELDLSIV